MLALSLIIAIAVPQGTPTVPPAVPPVPVETATAIATPVAPVAAPIATPLPTEAPSDYGYRFVPQPPKSLTPGQPQIYAVYLNEKHLHSHGDIIIRVETNENVVKMESKSNGRGGTIPQVAPGVFYAISKLPAIPFIASGMSTELVFVAHSADGRQMVVRVPIELG